MGLALCFDSRINAKYANATSSSTFPEMRYKSLLINRRTKMINGKETKTLSSMPVKSMMVPIPYNAIGMIAGKAPTISLEVSVANNNDEYVSKTKGETLTRNNRLSLTESKARKLMETPNVPIVYV